MEWESGKPRLMGQIDSRDTLSYSSGDQFLGALLRGGTHTLRIRIWAKLMRQAQRMEDQSRGLVEGVISPVPVENAGALQTARTAVDQVEHGGIRSTCS